MTNKTTAEEIVARSLRGVINAEEAEKAIKEYHQSRLNAIAKEVEGIQQDVFDKINWDHHYFDFHKGRKEVCEQVLKIINKHTE